MMPIFNKSNLRQHKDGGFTVRVNPPSLHFFKLSLKKNKKIKAAQFRLYGSCSKGCYNKRIAHILRARHMGGTVCLAHNIKEYHEKTSLGGTHLSHSYYTMYKSICTALF